MPTRLAIARLLRTLLIAALVGGGGCALLEPEPEPQADAVTPVSRPPLAAVSARRAPEIPKPLERILILASGTTAAYRSIADALDAVLESDYELVHASLGADEFDLSRSGVLDAAVAIGAEAAEFMRRELRVPIVFCQVFDYEHLFTVPGEVYGVAPLPPLATQLASWKAISADHSVVGMIVSERYRNLVAEARNAARETGIELRAQFAESDIEALYRFKRLAPTIDGFWLFPDNRILSPNVIREILGYGLSHGVQGIVFNPTLLAWGALISVGSQVEDVAATTARVLETVIGRRARELPLITPLTEVDVQINRDVAAALGLEPPES